MRTRGHWLINTPDIEVWPAWLLRARSNAHARTLSQASSVLRRKRDGAYLAADVDGHLVPLVPHLAREPGIAYARIALARGHAGGDRASALVRTLPPHGLHARLAALGLDAIDYAARTGLPVVPEPDRLAFAGVDRYRRALWLHPAAARAWPRMQRAVRAGGVTLEAISGYRSHAYQLGIFERKRARGLAVDDILAVNAAPGFSEHHAGRAIDIGAPGEPPAETSFESTDAFAWLRAHAGDHGFAMSYPRDNPHGIVYEPWHWYHRGS